MIHIQMRGVKRLRHNTNGLLTRARGPGSRTCVQVCRIVSLPSPHAFWYHTLEGRQLQRPSPSRRTGKRFQEPDSHRTLWDSACVCCSSSFLSLTALSARLPVNFWSREVGFRNLVVTAVRFHPVDFHATRGLARQVADLTSGPPVMLVQIIFNFKFFDDSWV